MAVGMEPSGYRMRRELERRGWSIEWRQARFDMGYRYGLALIVRDEQGEVVWRTAVSQLLKRARPAHLTLKMAMGGQLAAAFLAFIRTASSPALRDRRGATSSNGLRDLDASKCSGSATR